MFLVHCLLNHQNAVFQRLSSAERGLSDTIQVLQSVFYLNIQIADLPHVVRIVNA